jgi:hypothetical protein
VALAAMREVALDRGETEEHRCNAVTASVKALLWRKRHDEALKLCQEVVKGADTPAVIDAALRAGCLAERDRHGHLRAELDYLASWPEGAPRQAAAALGQELSRAVQALSALGARALVPGPVEPRLPPWAASPGALRVSLPEVRPPPWLRFEPGKLHPALRVAFPRMEPPDWYRRLSFPLLKEPKKK